MARSVIFVNNDPADWVLDELGARVVPGSGSLDVSLEISDNELTHAIQIGLGLEFKDDPNGRYLRINGIDRTAAESLGYGDQSDPVAAIGIATPTTPGITAATDKWALVNGISTGVNGGGFLSINGGDNTKFDLAEGCGAIADLTDSNNPIYERIMFGPFTAITPIGIGVADLTYIAIDNLGAVFQKTTPLTPVELRRNMYIGNIIHPLPSTTIASAASAPRMTFGRDMDMMDFLDALGPFSISGNVVGNNGVNLQLKKAAGQSFELGVNIVNSREQPSIADNPLLAPAYWNYGYRDGAGGWTIVAPTNIVDPDFYDDGSGTLAAVPAGYWSIQYIYMFPGQPLLGSQYGQGTYPTYDEAKAGSTDSFEIYPNANQLIFRAKLIVKQGATDLSDPSEARFIQIGKFGLVEGLAGTGGGEANTASNAGLSGTGIFNLKSGIDLEFKNLLAASTKITIADNPGQKTVDVDLGPHKDTHKSGGGDAFLSTDLVEAIVKRIQETGGPTTLTLGAIADGQILQRSGASVVGYTEVKERNQQEATASVTGTVAWTTLHTWTTGVLPAGTYKIYWSYEWGYSVTNRFMQRRVQANAVTIRGPLTHQKSLAYPATNETSGFGYITLVSPGTVTVNLDVKPGGATDTAYVERSRFEIEKV